MIFHFKGIHKKKKCGPTWRSPCQLCQNGGLSKLPRLPDFDRVDPVNCIIIFLPIHLNKVKCTSFGLKLKSAYDEICLCLKWCKHLCIGKFYNTHIPKYCLIFTTFNKKRVNKHWNPFLNLVVIFLKEVTFVFEEHCL